MDYKQFVIDYVEGRVTPVEFEKRLDIDVCLGNWLQSIVPEGKLLKYRDFDDWKMGEPHPWPINYGKFTARTVAYSVALALWRYEALDEGGPKGTVSYHYHVHNEITKLMTEVFPELELIQSKKPKALREMQWDVCPEYIDGKEIAEHNIVGSILDALPEELPKSKKIQLARQKIREAFHLEGKKHPYWRQPAQWPVHNGKPMKYEKTVKVNSELVQHHFVDPETGDVRIVDDSY